MRFVTIGSALGLLLIEAYFVLLQHLTGPWHIVALLLAIVILASLLLP